MFIDWPPGSVKLGYVMEENQSRTCIGLLGNIYGNMDAALGFYQLCSAYLIKMGFIRSKTDSCLFTLRNKKGELIMLTLGLMDNTKTAGTEKQLDKFKATLTERFKIKDLGEIKKHLGVMYNWEEDKFGPKVVITMKDQIGEIIKITESHLGLSV